MTSISFPKCTTYFVSAYFRLSSCTDIYVDWIRMIIIMVAGLHGIKHFRFDSYDISLLVYYEWSSIATIILHEQRDMEKSCPYEYHTFQAQTCKILLHVTMDGVTLLNTGGQELLLYGLSKTFLFFVITGYVGSLALLNADEGLEVCWYIA